MCCNFVIEPKVGVNDRKLARRTEQTENEAVQQTDLRVRRTSRGLTFADHMVRVSRRRREALLDEFERGGTSGAQFADYVGIKYSTFANWIQKRRRPRRAC
jgi:hypothetical protein